MFTIEHDIKKAFKTFFFDMSLLVQARNVYQHKERQLFCADIYVEFKSIGSKNSRLALSRNEK